MLFFHFELEKLVKIPLIYLNQKLFKLELIKTKEVLDYIV